MTGRPPGPGAPADTQPFTPVRPVLVLDDVHYRLPGRGEVLAGASLAVPAGGFVAITGPSGSGKSILLQVAGLAVPPTAGRVTVAGIDAGLLSRRRRCAARNRLVGFVPRTAHLLATGNALDTVALPLAYRGIPARRRRVPAERALERVGLPRRLAGERRLSPAERQRVAVARALVAAPRVILCDEPTGDLDSLATDAFLDLLSGLHADGVTLVIATHDPLVAARADRRARFLDGRVISPAAPGTEEHVTVPPAVCAATSPVPGQSSVSAGLVAPSGPSTSVVSAPPVRRGSASSDQSSPAASPEAG